MPPNAFGGAAHAPGYNGCGYPPYTSGPLGLWREPGFGPPGNSHFQQELVNAQMTLQMQRLSPTPMMHQPLSPSPMQQRAVSTPPRRLRPQGVAQGALGRPPADPREFPRGEYEYDEMAAASGASSPAGGAPASMRAGACPALHSCASSHSPPAVPGPAVPGCSPGPGHGCMSPVHSCSPVHSLQSGSPSSGSCRGSPSQIPPKKGAHKERVAPARSRLATQLPASCLAEQAEALLREAGGSMLFSQFCSKLYEARPTARSELLGAGGPKKWASTHFTYSAGATPGTDSLSLAASLTLRFARHSNERWGVRLKGQPDTQPHVEAVLAGGLAEGMLREGDVLLALNGEALWGHHAATAALKAASGAVALQLVRRGGGEAAGRACEAAGTHGGSSSARAASPPPTAPREGGGGGAGGGWPGGAGGCCGGAVDAAVGVGPAFVAGTGPLPERLSAVESFAASQLRAPLAPTVGGIVGRVAALEQILMPEGEAGGGAAPGLGERVERLERLAAQRAASRQAAAQPQPPPHGCAAEAPRSQPAEPVLLPPSAFGSSAFFGGVTPASPPASIRSAWMESSGTVAPPPLAQAPASSPPATSPPAAVPPASPAPGGAAAMPLPTKVEAIRSALSLPAGVALLATIQDANAQLGLSQEGGLVAQADRLLQVLSDRLV